ncbi:teichoic acid biosynthesis protein A, partial [Shigella boydii]|nr:teichoic acid biosynthesis protein A [Shigella boydii]
MIDNLIKRTPEINRLLENKRVTGVVTFVNPYSYYKIK